MSSRAWIELCCPECRERLVEVFGGRVLRVPHRTITAAERRALIRQALDAGVTYRDIAARLDCALSTVVTASKRVD